jgi:hypothetical protein
MTTTAEVPVPREASDVTAAATGVIMQPEYAKAIGRMAYKPEETR